MDLVQGPQQLEAHARQIIDEGPIRMLDDKLIIANSRPATGGQASAQNVSLARVSTYIYRKELSKNTPNQRIVFPTFASHWAVIVSDSVYVNDYPHAYHLTFEETAAAGTSPADHISRAVKLTATVMRQMPDDAKEVGSTRFSHAERMKIGDAMIKAFGSYHRVFWNCQHFARLYLHVITDGKAKFEEWTLENTSNLFLCAFVITIPTATTLKSLETRRAKGIIAQFKNEPETVDEAAILRASDEAIDLAQSLAIQDFNSSEPRLNKVEKGRDWRIDIFLGAIAGIVDHAK
jgi:hypothetical protein